MSNHICETSSFQSSTLGYQIMFFFDSRAPGTQTRSNFIKMTAQFLNRKLIRGALAEIFVDSYFQAKPFVPNLYQKRNKFFDLIFTLYLESLRLKIEFYRVANKTKPFIDRYKNFI